jgi:hypothetical protein
MGKNVGVGVCSGRVIGLGLSNGRRYFVRVAKSSICFAEGYQLMKLPAPALMKERWEVVETNFFEVMIY